MCNTRNTSNCSIIIFNTAAFYSISVFRSSLIAGSGDPTLRLDSIASTVGCNPEYSRYSPIRRPAWSRLS